MGLDLDAYRALTVELCRRLASFPEVIGVVALGSMAERSSSPDRHSDHDFFVVVEAGAQERFRADLSWLPEHGRVVLAYRETAHGLKVIYEDGHLLEFAVFSPDELAVARVNEFRVLLDRGDVAARMAAVRRATEAGLRESAPSDAWLLGQFLAALLVGAGRWRRGERLSGRALLDGPAVDHLVELVARHVPPAPAVPRDDLDPRRRFELAYPSVAPEIERALTAEPPRAALILLDLAERELGRLEAFPRDGAAALRRVLADD